MIVKVTTDRSVDTSCLESIVSGITCPGMSDEAKVIAAWKYVRRVMYHYRFWPIAVGKTHPEIWRGENPEERYDALKLINVYGYSWCSQQAGVLAAICKTMGFPARTCGIPGHAVCEVKYGGKWHMLDPIAGVFWYIEEGRNIASLEDLKSNPGVIFNATNENRVSKPYLPCTGEPIFEESEPAAYTEEFPWAFSFRHYDERFYAEGVKKWKIGRKARSPNHNMELKLKRGMRWIFRWDHEGKFYSPHVAERFLPPRHLCGEKDRRDADNFPYWEPYAKKINGKTVYRYYANGRLVYEPCIEKLGEITTSGITTLRKEEDTWLIPEKPKEEGYVILDMLSPYVFVGGFLEAQFHRRHSETYSRVYLSTKGEEEWKLIWDNELLGLKRVHLDLERFVRKYYNFRAKIELYSDVDTEYSSVRGLKLVGIFQHNMFALPGLLPGENRVKVTVKNQELLHKGRLLVTYKWQERDNCLSETRRRTVRVNTSPCECKIEVKGEKYPRMNSLEIKLH